MGSLGCGVVGALVTAISISVSYAAPVIPKGTPINEEYRNQFTECDANDTFNGVHFPIYNDQKKVRWYPCKSDPSRLSRLEKVTAPAGAMNAVLFVSKLALDLDGSDKACKDPGETDSCKTSLKLDPTSNNPCAWNTPNGKACVPVRAEHVPYVVIPAAAPDGIDAMEFRKLTGLDFGDYGVVILKDKVVPVIIADGGPAYKIGEGSAALRMALSGSSKDFERSVVFILFPNSHDDRASLTPDTLGDVVKRKGIELYTKLVGTH